MTFYSSIETDFGKLTLSWYPNQIRWWALGSIETSGKDDEAESKKISNISSTQQDFPHILLKKINGD